MMKNNLIYISALSILGILGCRIFQANNGEKEIRSATSQVEKIASKKMNVVFFLVDDLGWMDVGYNGSKFYETPNIDKFASESVQFNQAYAACHVCSPSRASILTGKYPARINLTDWLPGRKDFPFQRFLNAEIVQQLPNEEKTLPEYLSQNGYKTAIFGKWHLGDSSPPTNHGFQKRFPENWNKGWPLTYYSPYKLDGFDGNNGEYLTDRLTTEAINYIDENKEKPFFLFLSQFAVHDPIEGRPDIVKKYQNKLAATKWQSEPYVLEGNPDVSNPFTKTELDSLLKLPDYNGFSQLPNSMVKIKQLQDNVQFAAMVDNMDENFGRVLTKLKQLGIDDNTIVIFASDNGGMSGANFGNPTKKINKQALDKQFSTSNLPLRGAKGWFYEGGIRIPLLIYWPNSGKHGIRSDVPVVHTDFYPTILDMIGLPQQPDQTKDGESLVPLMRGGNNLKRKAIYWHFPHYSNHGYQSPGGAIRMGDYKLLEYYENGNVQLYNLKKDPREQNDLSKKESAITNQLLGMLKQWRIDVNAQMMKPNPLYIKN